MKTNSIEIFLKTISSGTSIVADHQSAGEGLRENESNPESPNNRRATAKSDQKSI